MKRWMKTRLERRAKQCGVGRPFDTLLMDMGDFHAKYAEPMLQCVSRQNGTSHLSFGVVIFLAGFTFYSVMTCFGRASLKTNKQAVDKSS